MQAASAKLANKEVNELYLTHYRISSPNWIHPSYNTLRNKNNYILKKSKRRKLKSLPGYLKLHEFKRYYMLNLKFEFWIEKQTLKIIKYKNSDINPI